MPEPSGMGHEPERDPRQLGNSRGAWLRCYRCWSQRLEAQVHYDAIIRVDPETGESAERIDEVQEAVVQCVDCMHDQPHLAVEDGRVVPVEDRWERMVAGTPWVASCTVTVDQDLVETCSGPEAADSLTYGAFGESGTREFFAHVRFHKHDEERIVTHLLVELYALGRGGDRRADRGVPGSARDHFARRGVAPAGARVRRGALAHSRTARPAAQ
jgi:hypothetical protein